MILIILPKIKLWEPQFQNKSMICKDNQIIMLYLFIYLFFFFVKYIEFIICYVLYILRIILL
jgi:hypothetical protein